MNLTDTLHHVSGLPKSEIATIAQRVLANSARLEACVGPHLFEQVSNEPLRSRWRCTKCQGEIDWQAHHWYLRGLKDGMG